MRKNTVTAGDDIIDSRDIIARIEELESEREELAEEVKECQTNVDKCDSADHCDDADLLAEHQDALEAAQETLKDWDDDNGEELKQLKDFSEEGENATGDWSYGATCIHESCFVEYCEELVKDIGDMPRNIPAYMVIDWEATAENLKADYSEIDFAGETYYVR